MAKQARTAMHFPGLFLTAEKMPADVEVKVSAAWERTVDFCYSNLWSGELTLKLVNGEPAGITDIDGELRMDKEVVPPVRGADLSTRWVRLIHTCRTCIPEGEVRVTIRDAQPVAIKEKQQKIDPRRKNSIPRIYIPGGG